MESKPRVEIENANAVATNVMENVIKRNQIILHKTLN